MNMEMELLQFINTWKGYLEGIATVIGMACALFYVHRKAFPREYKYLQKKFAFHILWAGISIAVVWYAYIKNMLDIIIKWFGISEQFYAILERIWSFAERNMLLTMNMFLVLFLTVYTVSKYICFIKAKKNAEKGKEKKGKKTFDTDAYQYDETVTGYVLKPEFVQIRTFYQYLCMAEILLCGLGKHAIENENHIEEVFIMLVALCFYTWEKYDYYSGYTLEEYKKRHKQETNTEIGMKLLELLKSVLMIILLEKGETDIRQEEQEAPDEKRQESGYALEIEKRLLEIQCSQNYRERCMGYYWYQILAENSNIHMDFLETALKLAGHQSIYFPDPFYRDLGSYIFPFLNLELLDNKKILILSGTQDREGQLKEWMISGLQSKYGKIIFWEVEEIQKEINTADIGIISLRYMNEMIANSDSYGFWTKVSVVILLEPSCFLSSHPVMIAQFLSMLKISREKLTYIVCDGNGKGMIDWLSHTLKEEFIIAGMPPIGGENFHVIADLDAECSAEAFDEVHSCMARRWELAVLLQQQAPGKIQWYGNNRVPVRDIAGKWKQLEKDFPEMETGRFEFYEDGNEAVEQECAWSVVEDSLYNFGEILHQYQTRGYQMSFTAVCSPHYMLRDFMVSHRKQTIDQLMPEFAYSERNMAIAVGHELLKGNSEWENIKRILQYYEVNTEEGISSILERLNGIYAEVFGLDQMWLSIDCLYHADQKERIMISTETGRMQFYWWYEENVNIALYRKEDMQNEEQGLEAISGGHIYQYYLPGQFLTVEGKYYRVENIFSEKGRKTVRLKRASNSYQHNRYYRQIRKIYLKEDHTLPISCLMQKEDIRVELSYAEITVQVDEYLCGRKFYALERAERIRVLGIPERVYRKRAFLKISVGNQNGLRIGVLLREIFYTLFPHCWQLLSVAMVGRHEEDWKGRLDELMLVDDGRKTDVLYIIEDSPMDLGLLEAVGHQFEMILSIINQYTEWGEGDGKEKVQEYFGERVLEEIGGRKTEE